MLLLYSFSLLPSKIELKKLVAKLSDRLAEIYYLMPDEFNILILGSEYSEKIEQWFMKLVQFFTYKMLPELSDCENEVLSSAFSVSIVKGISRIMYRNNLTIDELKRVLRKSALKITANFQNGMTLSIWILPIRGWVIVMST